MARIVDRPVFVHLDAAGVPRWFVYRGRRSIRQVLDTWREIGKWWERDAERTVYRVQTDGGGLFELEFRRSEQRWYLYKAYD